MMRIPDPLERMEASAERYMEENTDAEGNIRCTGCGKMTPMENVYPSSANPCSPPICPDCVERIQQAALKEPLLRSVADDAVKEAMRATELYGPFASAHEALGVILEEFEELKAEIFKKEKDRSRTAMMLEAMQIAAVAIRFVVDCATEEEEKK